MLGDTERSEKIVLKVSFRKASVFKTKFDKCERVVDIKRQAFSMIVKDCKTGAGATDFTSFGRKS